MVGIPRTSTGYQLGDLHLDAREPGTGVEWGVDPKGFSGWGATKSTINAVQRTRGAGAWAGVAYSEARHLSITGWCYAPSELLLSDALDRLNAAAALDSTILIVTEGGRARSVSVRREDEVLHSRAGDLAFTWSIQLVATDPRKLGTPLIGSTTLPASSGGLTIPYTVPYSIDAVTVSGQVNLTNPGNETGPVILRIDGPCHGPSITHVASGISLTFSSSLVLAAGEWLTIDPEAKTVMANDQASRSTYITSRGWFGFVPGANTYAFSASSFDAGALLTVTATSADK